MKATLIKLDTKIVDVPEYRSFFREIVKPGYEPLEANYEGVNSTYIPRDIKTVDYRMVELRGYKKGEGENGVYLVNDDMWYTAIPILDDIVKQRTIPLEKENVDLKIEVSHLSDVLKDIRAKWWYRLFTKISLFSPSTKSINKIIK